MPNTLIKQVAVNAPASASMAAEKGINAASGELSSFGPSGRPEKSATQIQIH